jgi:hypothetical protein
MVIFRHAANGTRPLKPIAISIRHLVNPDTPSMSLRRTWEKN